MGVRHGVWGKMKWHFKKDRESNGESNVWCKADGIEGNSGSDGEGKWSEMVQAAGMCWGGMMGMFWEKHWSEGQEEVRTTKEDVEDASGVGEQECWFGKEGKSGHPHLGVIYKPRSKLDWLIDWLTLVVGITP